MIEPDALDLRVQQALRGSRLSLFSSEMLEGSGQLALFLLLLEVVLEWPGFYLKPDVYVLLLASLLQSGWVSSVKWAGREPPWAAHLLAPLFYSVIEAAIEGFEFITMPHHLVFWFLSLLLTLGRYLNRAAQFASAASLGLVIARSVQALSPLMFYFSLELKGQAWLPGFQHFFADSTHVFLLVLSLVQAAGLISLSFLAQRQHAVIANLLARFKELSRWGFGASVVERVLANAKDADATHVQRCVAFIDIRGFTHWSEEQAPERVIAMLNGFYEQVLHSCGAKLVKAKMSADEVLLVLQDDSDALPTVLKALQAANASVHGVGLSAGAGAWIGVVVEGFFGARSSPVHDVIGDTVNTAKRLCDQAPAATLLAGPLARLPASMQTLPLQAISAKGKALPVEAVVCRQDFQG